MIKAKQRFFWTSKLEGYCFHGSKATILFFKFVIIFIVWAVWKILFSWNQFNISKVMVIWMYNAEILNQNFLEWKATLRCPWWKLNRFKTLLHQCLQSKLVPRIGTKVEYRKETIVLYLLDNFYLYTSIFLIVLPINTKIFVPFKHQVLHHHAQKYEKPYLANFYLWSTNVKVNLLFWKFFEFRCIVSIRLWLLRNLNPGWNLSPISWVKIRISVRAEI